MELLTILICVFVDFFVSCSAILSGGSIYSNSPTPRFVSRGNTFKVVTGDTVVLPCEIQNLGPFVIVWKRGTTLLTAGPQKITMEPRISLLGFNLQIKDIRHADQGDYTCQIGDGSQGDLIHTIEILMPPSIQLMPPSGQVVTRKGSPVSFECKANGNPSPTVQWSKKEDVANIMDSTSHHYVSVLNEIQLPQRLSSTVYKRILSFFGHVNRSVHMERLVVQGRHAGSRRVVEADHQPGGLTWLKIL
ncbi:limbic system-associated membrane protein-like [Sitophilus oryzae]|uniref:Limbic system-associated membrane protein-like n=1 Tax=Sitophilus oryzae TaxID=7048 RepID=A0A6J2XPS5_SITOR|nr:limbic system-associated membrane protein-like [Sitophilus oryzae]